MFEFTVIGSWCLATLVSVAWLIGSLSRYNRARTRYFGAHIPAAAITAADEVEQAATFLMFDLFTGAALGAVFYFWPMRGGAL